MAPLRILWIVAAALVCAAGLQAATPEASASDVSAGLVLVYEIEPEESAGAEAASAAAEDAMAIIHRRLEAAGLAGAVLEREGSDRLRVTVYGADDPQRVKELIGRHGRLGFHLVEPGLEPEQARREGLSALHLLLPSTELTADGRPLDYVVQREPILCGERLSAVEPGFQDGRPVIWFAFDAEGTRRFAEVTRQLVGRRFAIVLDGRVISAPYVREPILGGRGQIDGQFSPQEALELVLLLREGALPARLMLTEEHFLERDVAAAATVPVGARQD
jgi:protein-export membrane protein SecD